MKAMGVAKIGLATHYLFWDALPGWKEMEVKITNNRVNLFGYCKKYETFDF